MGMGMGMGMAEGLLLVVWGIVPAVLLFFIVYWAVRLAIRDERRRSEGGPRRRRVRRQPQ
ncbi:hypothetical protein GCM10009850_089240 [Nonomuraea monospora]|uniref:Uncharacterized protein n=1 Tax=Nonomuraea monospora TaxID=568818 RepID=A0ABN3CVF4_9ACTN